VIFEEALPQFSKGTKAVPQGSLTKYLFRGTETGYTSGDFLNHFLPMRRACITIGVDEVRGIQKLPKLRAAASGAEEFAAWAKRSDPTFETHCLTDTGSPVFVHDIKRLIRQIVESQSYAQLVVYFAGHGILKSSDTEIWLLSDAATDADEAVNLAGSIRQARKSGIPHVLFVSDACRSLTDDRRLSQVDGSMIFPIRDIGRQRAPEIDTFYGSLPGDPAYEVPSDEAAANYDGVFTKCLLYGLRGSDRSLLETVQENQQSIEVISSRTLKPWLEASVQDAINSVAIELNQFPELRVESQRPKYLTRVTGAPYHVAVDGGAPSPFPSSRGPAPAQPPATTLTSSSALKAFAEDNGFSQYFLREDEIEPRHIAEPRRETKFNRDMDKLLAAKGRESFETRTGFTVVGTEVMNVYVDRWDTGFDLFTEDGAQQIRIWDEHPLPARSVVIEFRNGSGTCLASLPGYIGTVVVEEGRVVNVSYTPSRNSNHWYDYEYQKEELERRRAFTAVAARQGIFKLDREMARSFAGYVRQLKAIDPTLGIYAAYAYAQSGLNEDVESVYRWMSEERDVPIPFDVALLADQLSDHSLPRPFRYYAPVTPMLTQGWSLLHKDLDIPEWLLEARRYTLPSLWTTFSEAGVSFVRDMLKKGLF
jgi:hypothetical protein